MRAQEEVLERIASLDPEGPLESEIRAQKEILQWVLEGDRLPEEYVMEGQLKMSGEFFEKVIIAGVDSSGRVYPSESTSEPGEYVLARRPTPQEWEEQK